MTFNSTSLAPRKRLPAFILLGLLIFLAYSNTYDVPWHLDDIPSITENPKVNAQAPHVIGIARPFIAFFEDGHLNRPLAMVTFATNWYFGKDNPIGYHVVNISIHLLAAYFLFQTMLILFSTPRMAGKYTQQQIYFACLFATALWALNPIQTQAITYIVQRMAALCAFFYILGLFCYLNARLAQTKRKRWLLLGGCLVSFVAGFLSKENAATLPLAILLAEAVFFLDLRNKSVRRMLIGGILLFGLAVVIVGAVLFYNGNPLAVLNYEKRFFTPLERLLTQFRVLWYYISLIFYPSPSRLSLVHDFKLSTSLWQPWTTLPAIALIFASGGLALIKMRQWPLVSFAVLFFLLNHIIESSIIPLEIVFEHRNYLPSMFLFLPLALGFVQLLKIYGRRNRFVYGALIAFVPMLLIGLGTATYVRNQTWSSAKLLWEDGIRKAPHTARAYHNLARHYYQPIGANDMAIALYLKAISLQKNNYYQESLALNNIAAIYYGSGQFEKAVEYWEKTYQSYPHKLKQGIGLEIQYRLSLALLNCAREKEALALLQSVHAQKPDMAKVSNLIALFLMKAEKPQEALSFMQKSLKADPLNGHLLVNTGACFHLLGDHQKALRTRNREDIALIWQIQNLLATDQRQAAAVLAQELLAREPLDQVLANMHQRYASRIYKSRVIFPKKDDALMALIFESVEKKLAAEKNL